MNISSIKPSDFTILTPSLKSISLKVGDVINAEVIDVMDSGSVSLRITTQNGQKTFIIAKPEVPLSTGENLQLKVVATGKDIRLQILGTSVSTLSNEKAEAFITNIYNKLSELSNSRLKIEDIKLMMRFFKTVPDTIKTVLPEINFLSDLMTDIELLTDKILKTSVEKSGVFFESRLKLTGSSVKEESLILDAKGLALKIINRLKDQEVINLFKMSGFDSIKMEGALNTLVKNIEFFQFTSYINNVLYTFLPVSWHGLRDGELIFSKERADKGDSYTCRINLLFDDMGRLSASVTLFNNSFYVTFHAERSDTIAMILSAKDILQKRFLDSGLSLKAVNVCQRKDIDFNVKEDRLDIKV